MYKMFEARINELKYSTETSLKVNFLIANVSVENV